MKKIALILALMVSINVSAQNNGDYYGVYDYKDSVLTLYYGIDSLKYSYHNIIYNVFSPSEQVKKIVVDSSMKYYHPTTYRSFFADFWNLEEIIGLQYLNPPSNGDMSYMFANCRYLKHLDLRNFSTRGVIKMNGMFRGCYCIELLNLSEFDTDLVEDMTEMFAGCRSLHTVFVGKKWSTANVKSSQQMFAETNIRGCKGTKVNYYLIDANYAKIDGGISKPGYFCDIERKEELEKYYAVYNDSTLTFCYGASKPKNSDIYQIGNVGTIAKKVKYVVFDPSFGNSSPLSCSGWFENFSNLIEIKGMKEYLHTEKCVNMSRMFRNCRIITNLDLSGLNTSRVEEMNGMFENCYALRTIKVDDKWNTHSVKQASKMFSMCNLICGGKGTRLSKEDASYARIDGGKDHPGYFTKYGQKVYLPQHYAVLQDSTLTLYYGVKKPENATIYFIGEYLGDESKIAHAVFDKSFKNFYPTSCAHWFDNLLNLKDIRGMKEYLNTQNVVYMDYMFSGCKKLESIDLRGFNTQKTKYMGAMFSGCESLKNLDLHTFNTSNVYDMCSMFAGCTSLESLDLSTFNTAKVKYFNNMFYSCENLKVIYVIDNWSTNNVLICAGMFCNNKLLRGGKGSVEIYSGGVDYAHIDCGTSNPGLFTKKGDPIHPLDNRCEKKNPPLIPYQVLHDSTLTLYYGIMPSDKGKPLAQDKPSEVKRIVFDRSFKNYYPKDCNYWFAFYYNLVEIIDMDKNLNTDSVTSMKRMFSNCSKLKTIDLSALRMANVKDFDYMFYNCYLLETIFVNDDFKTDSATVCYNMFFNCFNLYGGMGTKCSNTINPNSYAHIDGGTVNPGLFTSKSQDLNFDRFYVTLEKQMLTLYFDKRYYSRNAYPFEYITLDGCKRDSIKAIKIDKSFSNYYPESCYRWFADFRNLTEIVNIDKYFNTEKVTNMHELFSNCNKLTELDLSGFNTALVEDMGNMFYQCSNLKTVFVSDKWSTESIKYKTTNESLITNPYFYNYLYHDNGYLSMFDGCVSLSGGNGTVYNSFQIGKDYAKEDNGALSPGYFTKKGSKKSKETNQSGYAVLTNNTLTFYYGQQPQNSYSLNTKNAPEWTNEANNIHRVVFDKSFKKCRPSSCYEWFSCCCNLTEIVGMKENLNTENVRNMSSMFFGCVNLRNIDLSGFNTLNVTEMISMFDCCTGLESLNFDSFDTHNVRSMAMMFSGCLSLRELDLSMFNTENVVNMNSMFYNCKSLRTINLKGFNTSRTSNMSRMFGGCASLTKIDLHNFDFTHSKVGKNIHRTCAGLFENCTGFTHLDLSYLTVDSDIKGMFFGCSNLIDLKIFHSRSVDDISYMFYGCKNLTTLDLSNLIVNQCPSNAQSFFEGCSNLKTIYVTNNWNVNDLIAIEQFIDGNDNLCERELYGPSNFITIFKDCTSLIGGKGTRWDESNTSDKTYLRIDGGADKPGYFTRKE